MQLRRLVDAIDEVSVRHPASDARSGPGRARHVEVGMAQRADRLVLAAERQRADVTERQTLGRARRPLAVPAREWCENTSQLEPRSISLKKTES